MSSPTLDLAQALLRRPSVTPDDGGCQALLGERLEALGFACESLPVGDVSNLWATRGADAPLMVFAGHTDVVPTGDADRWRHPPFSATIDGDYLYGRGAADMKGAIACFVTACERFVQRRPGHRGRIGLLLTSDEEGAGRDGTRAVMEILGKRGEQIDYCLVGEPSCGERLGDTIKIGRRGSLSGSLTIHGTSGHIAYPELADNPIPRALKALQALADMRWDAHPHFPATRLQIASVHADGGAGNVIPGSFSAGFNLRFAPNTPAEQLRAEIEALLSKQDLEFEIDWHCSGEPFLTASDTWIEQVGAAVAECTGLTPEHSTGGGTSDGRFIAPSGAAVVEFGLCNATIHQIDERVPVADLDRLSACYEGILERCLA